MLTPLLLSSTVLSFSSTTQSTSGIDTYDYEPSTASFDVSHQDAASSEDALIDSEDEPAAGIAQVDDDDEVAQVRVKMLKFSSPHLAVML